jgi:hypothetical protein
MIGKEMKSRSLARMSAMLLALAVMALAPFGSAVPQRPKPLPQPSEAQLGAPVYPGSAYLAEVSGGMSMDETYYWVFVTSDPPSKVAAFYKAKTGLTPTELSGNFIFDLEGKKGSNPYMPEHGIAIEPNKQLTAGPPKTSITFNRPK